MTVYCVVCGTKLEATQKIGLLVWTRGDPAPVMLCTCGEQIWLSPANNVRKQALVWMDTTKNISVEEEPQHVWTVLQPIPPDRPELPMRPAHNVNAFAEDVLHDWSWKNGTLRYFSRVCVGNVWLLLEYIDR